MLLGVSKRKKPSKTAIETDAEDTKLPPKKKVKLEPISGKKTSNASKKDETKAESMEIDDFSIVLSDDQKNALKASLNGYNIHVDGQAGTGKSFMARVVAKALRELLGKNVACLTHTDSTATAISGKNVHKFISLQLSKTSFEHIVAEILKQKPLVEQWKKTDVLLLDEGQSVESNLLDKVDAVAKACRKSSDPFGGMQVIVFTDVFGLPSVTNSQHPCYETKTWRDAKFHHIRFNQVFRQKDQGFADLIGRARVGELSKHDEQYLRTRIGAQGPAHGIVPTILTYNSNDLPKTNNDFFNQLSVREVQNYTNSLATLRKVVKPEDRKRLNNEMDALYNLFPVPKKLELRIGAQVATTAELPGVAKGARGVVVRFDVSDKDKKAVALAKLEDRMAPFTSLTMWPVVQFARTTLTVEPVVMKAFDNHYGIVMLRGLPLKICFAETMFRIQGQTLSHVMCNLKDVLYRPGHAYIAISRVPSWQGLHFAAFSKDSFKPSDKALKFYKSLKLANPSIYEHVRLMNNSSNSADKDGDSQLDDWLSKQEFVLSNPLDDVIPSDYELDEPCATSGKKPNTKKRKALDKPSATVRPMSDKTEVGPTDDDRLMLLEDI